MPVSYTSHYNLEDFAASSKARRSLSSLFEKAVDESFKKSEKHVTGKLEKESLLCSGRRFNVSVTCSIMGSMKTYTVS